MAAILAWLGARLDEPSTWAGIAAFFASVGTGLTSAGYGQAGTIVGIIGGGFGGVMAFAKREKAGQQL